MNKTWFCSTHKCYFITVCIGCIDDIFHHGFGFAYKTKVTELEADYSWDDTWSYIATLTGGK